MRVAEHAQREQEKQAKRFVNSRHIHETKTSLMRKQVVKREDSKLWHMPKWGKVKPFLTTFPNEKAKVMAMSKHQTTY